MTNFLKRFNFTLLIFFIPFFIFCQKKPHIVTLLYSHPPRTIDPHLRNEIVTNSILSNIFESLVEHTPDLRIIPSLAVGYYQSDSLTWIFDIRDNVYFHNGKELEADDVVFSLYRPSLIPESEKSKFVQIIDTIYALNSNRVIIKIKFPYYFLLNELDLLYIIPKGYNDFSNPVGTGPYRITLMSQDSIVCERYQNYWGKKPTALRGVFKFIPALEERIKLIKGSKSTIMYGIPIDLYYGLKDSIKMEIITGVATRYLQFNLKKEPFDNKELRRAISMAIDRQEIDEQVYYGLAEPANQFIPKGVVGYCSNLPPIYHNPDSAKSLVKKFNRIKVTLCYSKSLQNLGEKIACYLCAVGIDVKQNPLEIEEFWSGVEKRKFDFYLISSLVAGLEGLGGVLLPFFYTYNPEKGTGLMNRSAFSNPEVDSLIDLAIRSQDPEQRLNFIKDIQIIMLGDMPVVPVVWEPRIYGISKNIEFKPRIDQLIRLKEIGFKE